MPKITVTRNKDNKILVAQHVPPKAVETYNKRGRTVHLGIIRKASQYEYLGDGEFKTILEPNEQPRSIALLPSKQLIIMLIKQLKKFGIGLDLHNDTIRTKQCAKDLIDRAAGKIKATYVSDGFATIEEYNQAYEQALDFMVNNGGDAPPMIATRALVKKITPYNAAQQIVAAKSDWVDMLNEIFHLRTVGKDAVDNASMDTYVSVANKYIEMIDNYKGK